MNINSISSAYPSIGVARESRTAEITGQLQQQRTYRQGLNADQLAAYRSYAGDTRIDIAEILASIAKEEAKVDTALEKARSLIGKHEVADKDEIQAVTKVDPSNTKWCAAFAMNVLAEAGVLDLEGLDNPNYCPSVVKWAKDKGIWGEKGSYQPKPGDAIVYDLNGDGTADHMGIVETVEGDQLSTIEGNSGNRVNHKTGVDANASNILGYVIGGKK